jgi:hypothetical protein
MNPRKSADVSVLHVESPRDSIERVREATRRCYGVRYLRVVERRMFGLIMEAASWELI